MPGRTTTLILGIVFYVLGAITVNVFLEPTGGAMFFHPAIELALIAIGIFLLSALFFGKYSFVLLLFAGAFLGGEFATKPVFVILALMPLLFAIVGGTGMGENAFLDLRGKKNFFEDKESYFAYFTIIVITAIIIGFLFGQNMELPIPGGLL